MGKREKNMKFGIGKRENMCYEEEKKFMEKQCRKWEGTGLLLGFVMGRKSTKMKGENVTRRYPHDRSM